MPHSASFFPWVEGPGLTSEYLERERRLDGVVLDVELDAPVAVRLAVVAGSRQLVPGYLPVTAGPGPGGTTARSPPGPARPR